MGRIKLRSVLVLVLVCAFLAGSICGCAQKTTTKETAKTDTAEDYTGILKSLLDEDPYVYVAVNNGSGSLGIVDSQTDEKVDAVSAGGKLLDIAMRPDGKEIFAVEPDSNKVYIFDMESKKVIKTLQLADGTSRVAFNPDGTKVYVTHSEGDYVSVIDTAKRQVTKKISVGKYPMPIAVSFDGTRAYVACYIKTMIGPMVKQKLPNGQEIEVASSYSMEQGGMQLSVIDLEKEEEISTVAISGPSSGVAVSPDGKTVCVTTAKLEGPGLESSAPSCKDTFTIIDAAKAEIIKEIQLESTSKPGAIAYTPDGKKVYGACAASDNAYVIDMASEILKTKIPLNIGGWPFDVAVRSDGAKVYFSSGTMDGGTLVTVDTSKETAVKKIKLAADASGQAMGIDLKPFWWFAK